MKLFDPAMKFYKGNTHAHSTNSDGRVSPEESMRQYREAGYDFLALTDHWHVGEERNYNGLLVIPGVEYDFTFETQALHIVCLYPDAKCAAGIRRGMTHPEIIRHVNSVGGVVIAAHPAWSLNTPDFLSTLDGVDIAEVYNTVSGEPFNGPRANSEGILDVTAANGRLYNLVAADDAHFYHGEQCVSYIMVQAEALTVPAVLDALRKGRFYATQGPEFRNIEICGDEIIIETSPVSRITVCSNRYWVNDRCVQGEGLTRRVYKVQPGERFVRIRLTDAAGRCAWSNPIAIER
ncbi:MAG: CehA/McbA family metallohydrolase [Clostridia bacterium]|nr:CehA/McbA family metallohydrolase [Clostridia bacterium]